MRSRTVLLVCLLVSCTNGADRSTVPRPPPSTQGSSRAAAPPRPVAPAPVSLGPSQTDAAVGSCPDPLSERSAAPAEQVLVRAVAACVDGRRFDGAAFEPLRAALGRKLTSGSRPKCRAGYPVVLLIADDGEHTPVVFCAQLGASHGYLGERALEVRDPRAVDSWLRSAGVDVPPRDYSR